MRIRLILALLLLPACIYAQERFPVRGRIVDEKGEAVEYVHVGIPRLGIGTVSTVDGLFEIEVPADTLEFHHVSYQTGYYPVSAPDNDLVIVLKESELPPAVFIGGDTKEKYLLRPGTRFVGAQGGFNARDGIDKGKEVGSVAKARKPFLIKDILFTVTSNRIPGCVISINIYRIEGKKESFVNMLHKPIYFDVAVADHPQDFDIQPDEPILLEPGRYFVAFQIVGYDEEARQAYLLAKPVEERKYGEMTIDFNIYLKSSYLREAALGKMEHYPVNIGIAVKGLEYQ